jgi:hypothetical protein
MFYGRRHDLFLADAVGRPRRWRRQLRLLLHCGATRRDRSCAWPPDHHEHLRPEDDKIGHEADVHQDDDEGGATAVPKTPPGTSPHGGSHVVGFLGLADEERVRPVRGLRGQGTGPGSTHPHFWGLAVGLVPIFPPQQPAGTFPCLSARSRPEGSVRLLVCLDFMDGGLS